MKSLTTFIFTIVLISSSIHAQKPSTLIFPADSYMFKNGYGKFIYTNDDKTDSTFSPDYNKLFLEDFEAKSIIQGIEGAFLKLEYPIKNLEQTLRSLTNRTTDMQYSDRQSQVSMRDVLLNTARADIRIEVDYQVQEVMGQKNVQFQLAAYDSYTSLPVATSPNMSTGPGGAASLNELVQAAVIKNIPAFEQGFINHFQDIVQNGRTAVVEVTLSEECWFDLEEWFGEGDDEEELSFIFRELIKDNTVNRSPRVATSTRTQMIFEDVRVPLFDDNGDQQDIANWANRKIIRELRRDFGLDVRREEIGLGRIRLIVMGER